MGRKTLVSIVTPSFNQGRFLEDTLSSVALQHYRPVEHIIVDGGSIDNTVQILENWSSRRCASGYSIEWVSEPDRGHADALNKGFARARGELIGWLNSDDVYFDRHVIDSAVEVFIKHPDVDVVFGDVALISETSGLWMIWCFPDFDYDRALRGYTIPQPTVFLRRRVVEKHRLDPSLRVGLDYVFWLQIGRECKFYHVGRVQAGDRDHKSRQTYINRALWLEVQEQARRNYGGEAKRTSKSLVLQDNLLRVAMRFKGVMHLITLFSRSDFRKDLAFDMWIDSPWKVLIRQLTMRLGNRPALKQRPNWREHTAL